MRFRFQVNGTIEFNNVIATVKDVTDYLNAQLDDSAVKITGVHVFEMIEKKDRGSRKRGV